MSTSTIRSLSLLSALCLLGWVLYGREEEVEEVWCTADAGKRGRVR